ncbi:Uncharacterized protein dnm_080040 [Desulfonema magnum]|uniref:Uncharacterized protein n=1 Tax=Desulfonema magnum TaxID=45655 RepID=A0A975GSC9_9BACT|nr:Uncharacterized protein dnm_080040 [Desulfonema magnum]
MIIISVLLPSAVLQLQNLIFSGTGLVKRLYADYNGFS